MSDPIPQRARRFPRAGVRKGPSARAVGDLLGEADVLAALRAGVRQVTALERDLGSILPEYLAPHVTVGTLKADVLTIFAGHSALAARLRHLERGLVQSLQQRGWPVSTFKVKVKLAAPRAPVVKQARVSAQGVQCLSSLAGDLEPGVLRDALERMIARHGGKS